MHLIGPPILRECHTPLPLSAGKPPITTPAKPLTPPQNPCTQFFFAANPNTPPGDIVRLIQQSWDYDPLITLRLICYLRTLKGEKLSSNEGFYAAALWLHKNHPLTLACNLREFAVFGSLRDFTEVLYRLVNEGEDAETKEGENDRMAMARRAVCKYVKDPSYRFLHERVSDIFADLLRSDIETLNSGNGERLSFAATECPSIDSSCDRHTLLCESIAKKVFPQESDPDYIGIEDAHYVYRVRNRLRKEVLGPLRSALEKEAQEKQGGDKDPFCTLLIMKKAYQKMLKMNDLSKQIYYELILQMIHKANSQFIPSTPLGIISLKEDNTGEKEFKWRNMVQAFTSLGKLRNSVAVCDISDAMKEPTRHVSISMGLLISEVSNELWKGTVYGFHESPALCKIEGDDLQSKVNFMKQIKCTEKVNIEAILNQVLHVGVSQKLDKEKMVDRIFVFTNKDLRKALPNCWGWNYRAVWENYQKFGYEEVPEVVFWNIEGLNDCPPTIRTAFSNTMVIINGFSRSLFAFFLDKDAVWRSEEIKSVTTAEDLMKITLLGKEYQNLAVLD